MFSTESLEYIKYMLMYFGLVFLAKEAVWEKLTETGKDRFDIVSGIGFAWTIFLYTSQVDIFSIFQGDFINTIGDRIGSFLLSIVAGYIIGKGFVNRRKRKSK